MDSFIFHTIFDLRWNKFRNEVGESEMIWFLGILPFFMLIVGVSFFCELIGMLMDWSVDTTDDIKHVEVVNIADFYRR